MKHKLYTRLLSLALAVGLVIGMLPSAAAVDTVGAAIEPRLNANQFTVQHVDTQGNEITDSDIKNLSAGQKRNPNAYIKNIPGYNYSHAKVGNSVVTEIRYYRRFFWEDYMLQYNSNNSWNTWINSTPLTLVYSEPLSTVETVDSASKGVNISLFNYQQESINKATNSIFRFGGGESGGYDWNYWESQAGVYQGIVGNQLTTVGNVKVPTFAKNQIAYRQQNLSYLFTSNTYATAYTDLNHLFLKSTYDSTGYYEYDAGKNFATIKDNSDQNFKVYNQPYKPGDTAAATPKFLPFNDLSNNADSLKESTGADYLFGMMVDFEFVQPQSGKITNNGATNDMVFEFTGDDDVWVFIDDVLVLDMGGIHDAMTGSINFATGEVKVNKVRPDDTEQTKTLYDIMSAAKGPDWVQKNMVQNEDEQWIFKDYTSHTFNYYYLERGAGGSNCRIRFNLQTVPKGSLNVGKTAVGESANINYKFQLKNSNGQAVSNKPYTISGTSQTGTTDDNGYFTLKSGQLATFTDLSDGAYTVTELDGNSYKLSDYTTTVTTTDGNGTSSGQVSTSGTVTIDPATAATVGFTNTKAEKGEGSLEITKSFTDSNGHVMAIPEDLVTIRLHIQETYTPTGESYNREVDLTKDSDGVFKGTLDGVFYYTDFKITEEELLNAKGEPIANAGDWTVGDFVLDRYADATATGNFQSAKAETVYTLQNSGYVLVQEANKWYLVMNHVPSDPEGKAEFKEMVIDAIIEAAESTNHGNCPSADEVTLLTVEEAAQQKGATLQYEDFGNVVLTFHSQNVWSNFYYGSFNMTNVTMKATLDNILNKAAQTQVSVNKVWDDSDNPNRPTSVTVNLMNGNQEVREVTLNSGNSWKHTFTELPKYNDDGSLIQYTVTEDAVSGYTTSITGDMTKGFTITNTRDVGNLTIEKTVEGLDDTALDELKGKLTFTVTGPDGYTKTIKLGEDGWSVTGNTYTYILEDVPTGSYTVTETGYDTLEKYSWVKEDSTATANADVTKGDTATAALTNVYIGKDGKLNINKVVTGFANDGKAVFDFKLTAGDGTVYYYHVDMTDTAEGQEKAVASVTLPVGDYTITELRNQNYTLNSVDGATANNDGIYTVTIKPQETTTVTFTNDPKNTDIPTDGGATENRVDKIEDGVIVWKKEVYGTDHPEAQPSPNPNDNKE